MPTTHSRRPPGRPAKERRRPEGRPTLPKPATRKRPTSKALASALPTATEAWQHLAEEGRPDLAAAVDVLIAYAAPAAKGTKTSPDNWDVNGEPFSLYIEEDFRQHLDNQVGTNLSAAVAQGFREYLEGRWSPPRPRKYPKGLTPPKTSLSVRVPLELVQAVDDKAKDKEETKQRGYALNARQVAIAALERQYGSARETSEIGWETDERLLLNVPEAFRDRVQAAVMGGGRYPTSAVCDAFKAFMNGSWEPEQTPRAAPGHSVDKVRLVVPVNAEIRAAVEQLGNDPDRVAARGYKLSAVQVAAAALCEAYEIPRFVLFPWLEAEPAE